MQAKQQVISSMKQEAHALGTEMEQKVLHLQEENCTLRHKLEVNSALSKKYADVNLLQPPSARPYLRPDSCRIHWYVSQLLAFV